MGKQDALFLLIKSLSSGEKAVVRNPESGKAGYVVLFDLIARQKEFDERKVRKKLLKLGVDINYSYAKNYLTKHILKSLREYRDASGSGLHTQVLEIEILMARKVFGLAAKMLGKARTRAWKTEQWHLFIRLTKVEMTLLAMDKGNPEKSIDKIRKVNEARVSARRQLGNLGEFQDLYYLYRPILMRKQRARNEWDLDLIKEFAAHPLMKNPEKALCERARRVYFRCQILIKAFTGDFETTFKLLGQSLEQYRKHEFLVDDHAGDFINDLLRHGVLLTHFEHYAQVDKTLREIRAFQKKSAIHGSEIFDKYYRLLLGYALATKDYKLVNAELDNIRAGLKAYAESLPWATRCNTLFLMGRVAFEQKDFRLAAGWFNEILDETNRGIREDLVSLSRILLIFTYYERGEFELVESSSRATRKYLRRREQLFRFEARILSFLEKNSFHATSKDEIVALRKLRTDLEIIFKDKLEANICSSFDILPWLDEKIAQLEA
ncbi:MAG TPA: hypothetical protein ENJ82_00735 [Bacteroidetes bacterium]|nr:hypothetical protein [Bacteroidota bacterium]